jgi:hypothetical protein
MHRCKERQMNKKYIVQLTPDQRVMLEHLTRTGITTAAKQRHARILLKADAGSEGPAWEDAAIAAAVEVSVPTVERIRRVFVTQGLEGAPAEAHHARLPTQAGRRPRSATRCHRL